MLTEMPSQSRLRSIIGRALRAKAPGTWSGSAYRCHISGIMRGPLKITDHNHVSDHCTVSITNAPGWRNDYSRDPKGSGDPYPRPIGEGEEITVWEGGRWVSPEYRERLEPAVLKVLNDALIHTLRAENREAEVKAQEQQDMQQARRHAVESAIERVEMEVLG